MLIRNKLTNWNPLKSVKHIAANQSINHIAYVYVNPIHLSSLPKQKHKIRISIESTGPYSVPEHVFPSLRNESTEMCGENCQFNYGL